MRCGSSKVCAKIGKGGCSEISFVEANGRTQQTGAQFQQTDVRTADARPSFENENLDIEVDQARSS